MAMVRYQMFLEEGQKRVLDELHRKLNVPVAQLIRQAIDSLIAEHTEAIAYKPQDEQINRLLSLSGVCDGGPGDLADNHDKYLRGDRTE